MRIPDLDAHDSGLATGHASPAEVAERAVGGEGEQFPHAERIQTSFGKHDISGIRTHIGGDAAQVSHELDAHAFTINGGVAFAQAPGLALAAHEAAHVIQQRAGATVLDDETQEEFADRIADKILRGESVEPLLDQIVGTGSQTPVVQFKKRKAAAPAAAAAELEGNFEINADGNGARIRRTWVREKPIEHW